MPRYVVESRTAPRSVKPDSRLDKHGLWDLSP